jgi:AcrR family transcriptional regulator
MNIDTKSEQCSCQVLVFSIENNQTGCMPASSAPTKAATEPATPPIVSSASAPRSARERVREEVTGEILAVAGAHLGREGAAALSLRSVARDLGMAPSALYRYFDGRDALLSALILEAYEALAGEAERAADQAATAADPFDHAGRWCWVPRALRRWALEHPHQWGLIFGTPIPGYHAPRETIEPYTRTAAALVRPLILASEAGRLRMDGGSRELSGELRAAVAPVAEGLLPGMPAEEVVRALAAWSTIVGAIGLEVFGHWRNTVWDPGLLFEATISDLAHSLGLR